MGDSEKQGSSRAGQRKQIPDATRGSPRQSLTQRDGEAVALSTSQAKRAARAGAIGTGMIARGVSHAAGSTRNG